MWGTMDVLSLDQRSLVPTSAWADRCAHWLHQYDTAVPHRKRRDRQRAPLILCGHGLSIRVDKHTLLIRDGKTHYPADERAWRFFKGGLDVPSRIVIVDGSGEITLDALRWLAEQNISLILLSWDGSTSSVQCQTGYISDPKKVRRQQEIASDPKKSMDFAIKTLVKKLQESIITLDAYFSHSPRLRNATAAIEANIAQLKGRRIRSLSDLLGLEGGSAVLYFSVWNDLDIKWKGLKRQPIPDDWQTFKSRSSLTGGVEIENRKASHPVNAMLNYAYAVLYRHVLINVIAEGFDPNIGVMHKKTRKSSRHDYVLDSMEPMRPVVDRAVLDVLSKETFAGSDFQLQANGVCRLNPQLARRVVQAVTVVLKQHC